jgi:hypothetical protein
MFPTTWGRKVVHLSCHTIPTEPFVQEQLIDVFKSVGQVVGFRSVSMLSLACASAHINAFFRLVFDRETGKPRGYGFCEFAGTSNSFFLFVRLDACLTSNWLFSAIPPYMCFSTRVTRTQTCVFAFSHCALKIMKPLHLLCGTSIMPMSVAALYESTSPTLIPSSKARPLCEASCSMGVIQEAAGVIIVSTKTVTATDMIIFAINPNLKTQILSCQVYHLVYP